MGFKMLLHLVHHAELAKRANELVSRNRQLRFEKGQPEDSSFLRLKRLADVVRLVFVYYVLEVDLLQVICPRMKHLEALILHVLGSVSFDIISNKSEAGRVGHHGVLEIVLLNGFARIFQEM